MCEPTERPGASPCCQGGLFAKPNDPSPCSPSLTSLWRPTHSLCPGPLHDGPVFRLLHIFASSLPEAPGPPGTYSSFTTPPPAPQLKVTSSPSGQNPGVTLDSSLSHSASKQIGKFC